MKNNKGFTLVELLAVILILLGLSVATSWGITSTLKNRDEKELEEQKELAIGAGKIYFSLNDTITCVKITELKNNEYFANNSKIDKIKSGSLGINGGIVTYYKKNNCTN